uniref:Uncharacterized protein n=1 Tax=Megaselia scalaris TaxID=36166 RepID=T1GU19_MEGSC
MTNELLELQPNHQRAKGNKNWYENVLKEQEEDSNKRGDDGTMDVTISSVKMELHKKQPVRHTEHSIYEALCRGDLKQTPAQQRDLVCKYPIVVAIVTHTKFTLLRKDVSQIICRRH